MNEARWNCRASGSADHEPVDIRDMLVVHTALLREFRLIAAAVAESTGGDRKRAATTAAHLRVLCAMLHHHHAGEDALLWPLLRDRAPTAVTQDLDMAEAQHAGIDAALTAVDEAGSSWRTTGSASACDRLAARLDALNYLLGQHIETICWGSTSSSRSAHSCHGRRRC
jgi:iron-sulfur cluster repair protein YtfE (RIC family)